VNVFVEKSLLILGQHSIQPIRFEEQVYMSSKSRIICSYACLVLAIVVVKNEPVTFLEM